eukprot:827647_1
MEIRTSEIQFNSTHFKTLQQTNVSCNLSMIKPTKSNHCCGCLSTINAVRLTLSLEALMCIVVPLISYSQRVQHNIFAKCDDLEVPTLFSQYVLVFCLTFSIASCIATISGTIGLCGNNKLCLKVFGVSSIVASVICVLFCIIWMAFVFLLYEEPFLADDLKSILLWLVSYSCLVTLRIFVQWNWVGTTFHKFVTSLA